METSYLKAHPFRNRYPEWMPSLLAALVVVEDFLGINLLDNTLSLSLSLCRPQHTQHVSSRYTCATYPYIIPLPGYTLAHLHDTLVLRCSPSHITHSLT